MNKMVDINGLRVFKNKSDNDFYFKLYELLGIDPYNSTETYAVDDYVCYTDTRLYKCNTAISQAEDWTPAHWTQVTLLEFLQDVLSV